MVVGSIAVAGKAAEDGPVSGHVLKSPSLAANRMLQVYFRIHTLNGYAHGFLTLPCVLIFLEIWIRWEHEWISKRLLPLSCCHGRTLQIGTPE